MSFLSSHFLMKCTTCWFVACLQHANAAYMDPCFELCIHDGPTFCTNGSVTIVVQGEEYCSNYFYEKFPEEGLYFYSDAEQPHSKRVPVTDIPRIFAGNQLGIPPGRFMTVRGAVKRWVDNTGIPLNELSRFRSTLLSEVSEFRISSEREIWHAMSGSRIMQLVSETLYLNGAQGGKAALLPFIVASRLATDVSFDDSFAAEVGLHGFCSMYFNFIRDSIRQSFAEVRSSGLSWARFIMDKRSVALLRSVSRYCPVFLGDIQSQGIFLALNMEIRTPNNSPLYVRRDSSFEANLEFLVEERNERLRAVNLQIRDGADAPRRGLAVRQWLWDMGKQISASGLVDLTDDETDLHINRKKYIGIGRYLGMALVHRVPTGIEIPFKLAVDFCGVRLRRQEASNWDLIKEGFLSVLSSVVLEELRINPDALVQLLHGEATDSEKIIGSFTVSYDDGIDAEHRQEWLYGEIRQMDQTTLDRFLYLLTGMARFPAGGLTEPILLVFKDSLQSMNVLEGGLEVSATQPESLVLNALLYSLGEI